MAEIAMTCSTGSVQHRRCHLQMEERRYFLHPQLVQVSSKLLKFVVVSSSPLANHAEHNFQHTASGDSDVYLYRFDDYPMISSLGFYRTADEDWYSR